MKHLAYLYSFFTLLLLAGCDKTANNSLPEPVNPPENTTGIPEGYFVATFSGYTPDTRAAISGPDTRVQHVRYLVYKKNGEFLKERIILTPGNIPTWPLTVIRDTLPKGEYKIVFLANVEKTLFPFIDSGTTPTTNEVLMNYKSSYNNALIDLPNTEFKATTEYYLAKADFSDTAPNPYILLQRIISLLNLHRNVVDAKDALNKLVNNIVTQINYKNILQNTTQGILHTKLSAILGLGDILLNAVINALIAPVTNALYDLLLQQLVAQLGTALQANENQDGLLGVLGILLNPWENSEAHTAIVTIRNFPKSIGYDLAVKEYYTGTHTFRFDFTSTDPNRQKSLDIKGFSDLFDIRKINVIKQGLVSGLLVDRVIDSPLLLNGTFVDINDTLSFTPPINRRFKSDYSLLDLGLKDYTQQTDGNHSLTLTVKVGDIANIDGILSGIPGLGLILNTVSAPIKNIQVAVPVNLPLLGVDNLKLSGGWSTPVSY